ncbi:MAG: hypothetical protein DI630_25795 [Gordonia sp. (in: high G+C Gram-positive bacteria)]|nr:MAG: hypothetical protein DI630_25795 [Gordonia sp. (in: high G+C Gram-positive bacteria)]
MSRPPPRPAPPAGPIGDPPRVDVVGPDPGIGPPPAVGVARGVTGRAADNFGSAPAPIPPVPPAPSPPSPPPPRAPVPAAPPVPAPAAPGRARAEFVAALVAPAPFVCPEIGDPKAPLSGPGVDPPACAASV